MLQEKIKWHPAFVAAIKLEFKEYEQYLEYSSEHELTHEPLKIDVVIIKKLQEIQIEKSIGRILRKYNIFEYKSPSDYISIDDYFKVKAYTYLYKIQAEKTQAIDIDDITITLTSSKPPKKLLEYLKSKNTKIIQQDAGVYYIENAEIATQLLINEELSTKDAFYLKLLQKHNPDQRILSKWVTEYQRNAKIPLYKVIMDVIAKSNMNEIMEVYKAMGMQELTKENEAFVREVMAYKGWDREFLAEGKLEGKLEGELKGKLEGELKGRQEVARLALQEGAEVAFVAKITGLSIETVTELKSEIQKTSHCPE